MFNDPEFQESYNEWCEKLDEEWRNDPEAQRKFAEWCDEQERIERETELETLEHEAYEAELDRQAEEAELARLGDAYLIAANTNHDLQFGKQGGNVVMTRQARGRKTPPRPIILRKARWNCIQCGEIDKEKVTDEIYR